MNGFYSLAIALALSPASPINAEPRCADLALVLAIDTSSSIDEQEFQLQVLGYAAAFSDPAVLSALNAAGTVDVASVFWADSAYPPLVSTWVRISGEAGAGSLSDSFQRVQRRLSGNTDLGSGLMAALDLLEEPGQCSAREVVNVSGDGRASFGDRRPVHVSLAKARARAEAMGVTVNGLAILNEDAELADYYMSQLITGPGAFVMEVQDFRAFREAIVRKLEREIQPQVSASLESWEPEMRPRH